MENAILQKCGISQKQALDLLSSMEVAEELLVTAISHEPDAEFPWATGQRADLAIQLTTVSAQLAHIAANLRKP